MDEQLFPQQPTKQHVPAPTLEVTTLATRVKLSEERYTNLLKRNQLNESTLLEMEKEMRAELAALTHKTVELRKQITDVNEKVNMILGELASVVQKHEFATVERYLDLWQPMQWITKEEAKRMITELRGGKRG